jgi:hypothetical protein
MVSGDVIVQVPPDSFDGIGFWSILGQVVQFDTRMFLDIVQHCFAMVEAGVVTDDMNASIASQGAA